MKDLLGLENISQKIQKEISTELEICGLMFRVFSRVKNKKSIDKKIKEKNYRKKGSKITDLIGIRITLYFKDDVDFVYNILKKKDNFNHESTDPYSVDEFKPIRCNLTFNIQDKYIQEVNSIINSDADVIDSTYEVQIRTVLSEGWHEVEHDLRYKSKDEWKEHSDLNRNLNGIFATLETSEFSMLQVLESLAYRHYKDNNIVALIKFKFRMRLIDYNLDSQLKDIFIKDNTLLKKILKVERSVFLTRLNESKFKLPLTLNNLIYLINFLCISDSDIRRSENMIIRDMFDEE